MGMMKFVCYVMVEELLKIMSKTLKYNGYEFLLLILNVLEKLSPSLEIVGVEYNHSPTCCPEDYCIFEIKLKGKGLNSKVLADLNFSIIDNLFTEYEDFVDNNTETVNYYSFRLNRIKND